MVGQLVRLRALCADIDSEAEDLIETESALLSSACQGHHRAIATAVRGFDFDRALTHLGAAAAARMPAA